MGPVDGVTLDEAAHIVGCSRSTLVRHIFAGRLAAAAKNATKEADWRCGERLPTFTSKQTANVRSDTAASADHSRSDCDNGKRTAPRTGRSRRVGRGLRRS